MAEGDALPPEARRRAPDPSLTEMLRRARDTPLPGDPWAGGHSRPHLTPLQELPMVWGQVTTLPTRVAFWVGVVVGAFIMLVVTQAGPLASSAAAPTPATAQYATPTAAAIAPVPTDTPLPTATDTPEPMPTDTPTVTAAEAIPPLTTDEIVALAKDYYDHSGPFASKYVLLDATGIQIQGAAGSQLTVCITYEVAAVTAPDVVADTGTRAFTFMASDDGTWRVTQVGEANSCSLG